MLKAEDPDFQLAESVQKFLLSDEPVDSIARAPAFTAAAIDDGSCSRAELAELPITHLNGVAQHYNVDVSKCVTPFEYTDKIMLTLDPSSAPAASEMVDLNESVDGEGFAGYRPESVVSDDGSNRFSGVDRASSSAAFESEANAMQAAKLAAFREFIGVAETAGPRLRSAQLPITVDGYLKVLGLDRYCELLKQNGYDDLRVITALTQPELAELSVAEADHLVLMRAGFEWTIEATAHNLLENWTREQHRAGDSGVFTAMSASEAQEVEEMEAKDAKAAAEAQASGKPILSADGMYYIGPDGKMDLKTGDEVIKMGWGATTEWDPTPVLNALYDSPVPEKETLAASANDPLSAFQGASSAASSKPQIEGKSKLIVFVCLFVWFFVLHRESRSRTMGGTGTLSVFARDGSPPAF